MNEQKITIINLGETDNIYVPEYWSKTMDLRYVIGRTGLHLQQKSISNLGNIEWNFIEESDE